MGVIKCKNVTCRGIRFSLRFNDKEIGRAFLYIMHNDLHKRPHGLLEDVFVEESSRGEGTGNKNHKKSY